MKKFFLLFFCCFVLQSLQLMAQNNIPPPPTYVEDAWNNDEDGDRSLSCSPSLTRDAHSLYLYSEKQLENLYIGISNAQGDMYYVETTTVTAGVKYAVSIEELPMGTYYFTISKGNRYIVWCFTKS